MARVETRIETCVETRVETHVETCVDRTDVGIATQGLSKHYKRPVVRDVSFSVERGEVYALVGPNGAGKTSVIRLVCGLAFPSAGTVRLLGADPLLDPGVRRRLGAVVEAPAAFYPYLTGRANLRLHARLAGGVSETRIDEVLELLELGNAAERRVGIYSLGMRQRLGVAAALLTDPEVLILDEPASGMDPLSLHLVHQVLRRAAAGGAAVLISTHHLDEVVTYCSRVGILEEGALIDEVDLAARRDRYRARVGDVSRAQVALATEPTVQGVEIRGHEVVFAVEPGELGRVAQALVRAGVALFELTRDSFDLRSYYRERLARRSLETQERRVEALL